MLSMVPEFHDPDRLGIPSAVPEAILFWGVQGAAERFAPALSNTFEVVVVGSAADAHTVIVRRRPSLVIMRVDEGDREPVVLCANAKRVAPTPAVLVTTPVPEMVPEA